MRGWFESLADGDGTAQRDELREKIQSQLDSLKWQSAFEEESVINIGKAFRRLEADRFTFEEFATAAKLRFSFASLRELSTAAREGITLSLV